MKEIFRKKITSFLLISIFMLMNVLTGCEEKASEAMATAVAEDVTANETQTKPIETTEAETTEPPFVQTEINLMMIGDMLMHEGVQSSGLCDDGTYNYDHLFRFISEDIKAADIAIVNQEVILGGVELGLSGYPCFNCAYEVGDAIAAAGFNVVLHATNHTLDKRGQGVDNCINYWRTNHPKVAVLGMNETEADTENIYVYEQNGIKIAILNYTYGTNGINPPEGREYIVNYLDEDRVINDLAKANEIADFVIVCPHWGTEYTLTETDNQKQWAQLFADNGADLVIGTHPHVIEPVKWVDGANGGHTLVYYSLGNFVSNQDRAARMLGAMAKVVIADNEDGEVFIKEYGVEPLVTHQLSGAGQIGTYRLSDYTSELASQNRIMRKDSTFSYDYLVNTSEEVFGDLYSEGESCIMVNAEEMWDAGEVDADTEPSLGNENIGE